MVPNTPGHKEEAKKLNKLESKRNIAKDTPGHNTLIIPSDKLQPTCDILTSEDTKRKQIVEMLPNFKSIVL